MISFFRRKKHSKGINTRQHNLRTGLQRTEFTMVGLESKGLKDQGETLKKGVVLEC